MTDISTFSGLLDILLGGVISLLAGSMAGHFGFRSADRLPGESRLPHCFYCLRPLQIYEYLPLAGWLMRHPLKDLPCPCGKRSHQWFQPLIEVLAFVMGAVAVGLAGWSSFLIPVCLALGLLPAIALIDIAFGIIPDGLNLLLAALGLSALVIGDGDIFLGLIGAAGLLGLGLMLAIVYSRLRKKEMLGIGDVKFFGAVGLWLPVLMIPWFLVASGVLGAVMGLVWRHIVGAKSFPFAPALCLSLAGFLYYQLYLYAMP